MSLQHSACTRVSVRLYYRRCWAHPPALQLEQTGSTLFQTVAGLVLDGSHKPGSSISKSAMQFLLNSFVILNVAQFLSIVVLGYFQNRNPHMHRHHQELHGHPPSDDSHVTEPQSSEVSETEPLLQQNDIQLRPRSSVLSLRDGAHSRRAIQRGKVMMALCVVLIASAWIMFLGTAWFKLRRSHGDGGH